MANGSQTILPPSRHPSGGLYTWEPGCSPEEMGLAPAPAWLVERLRQEPPRSAPRQNASTYVDGPALDRVQRALATIPNDDAGYDDWLMIGMALHSTGEVGARELWDTWSQQSGKYDPDKQEKSWQSFTADGAVTIGSLFHLAKTHGWVSAAARDASQRQNGHTPGPEPQDPYACPALPAAATVDEERASGASIWLDDYIAFSKQWAPRAYEGFHEAVALFALATTSARRIKIQFGPRGVYTSLYLGLASRTSLYTKTTAVDIGMGLLRRAGLQSLIADDDATPQAFLRSLTLHLPPDYAEWPEEAQLALRERLAFAGQKGWHYEEWGQHLQSMMQKEGLMAAFRSILRRLDDHQDEYVYGTISRGRDVLQKPFVSLLANVTPADLRPFVRAQSPLWRDGYIARFAFVAPGDAPISQAHFPEGEMVYPRHLITTIASWHKKLGIPRVILEPIIDQKGKDTGRYQATFSQPHKDTTYTLSPDVRKAYYAYDDAMHTLMGQTKNEDLDGSYARFPMKALRIAGLLASLHDDGSKYTIWPAQWYRGQQIAERWRQDIHKLIKQVNEQDTPSREGKGEQRVIDVLKKHGELSPTKIHVWTKLAHTDILQHLDVLQRAGVVREVATQRTKKYAYIVPEDHEGQHDEL